MSQPHKCPVCEGSGIRPGSKISTREAGTADDTIPCHACDGKGVVWEPGWNPDNNAMDVDKALERLSRGSRPRGLFG